MISLRIRAALAALTLAFLTVPTPAQAQPAAPASYLRLTIKDDTTGAARAVDLHCDPAGGSHPQPQDACAAIEPTGGDLDLLKGRPGVLCNDLYQPVTAFAQGAWQGRPVAWQHAFANPCGLHTKTDAVFHF
ncbi:SSI family serine proteinase inhibitor [Kitasatospora sp. GAS1066B]|uniref:SSI family serine proteinase inhibitor n=1 Tax=Kitasatospora sp. GAS1066B TaxID=3156271 RepID=UPI003515DA83